MSPGGKRENAGRPSQWKSGVKFKDTKPIRIPAYLKDVLLDIAIKLDAGHEICDKKDYLVLAAELEQIKKDYAFLEQEKQQYIDEIENLKNELVTKCNSKSPKFNIVEQDSSIAEDSEKVTNSSTPEQLSFLKEDNDYKVKEEFRDGLTTTDLAKRFELSQPMITKKRKQGRQKFLEYCLRKDPEKIIWQYNENNKKFYPLEKL